MPLRHACGVPSLLIIVLGPPASGKTTLSTRLATDLHLPVLSRDTLKEILFDTLGYSDRAWSRRLGGASYEVLYAALSLLLQTGHPCIVESNFAPAIASIRLNTLIEHYHYTPLQIVCSTEPKVLIERYRHRTAAGDRHPGHVDHIAIEELDLAEVQAQAGPLALAGSIIELDTTNFAWVDYTGLVTQLRQMLTPA